MNMVSMVGQTFALRLLGFVSMLVLARVLSPIDLGGYSVTNTTALNAGRLSRLGIDAGVHALTARLDPAADVKKISDVLGHALALMLAVGCLAAVICFATGRVIASNIFGDPSLQTYIELAAALLILQMLSQYCYSAFAGLHFFTHYSRASATTALFPPGLTVLGGLYAGGIGAVIGLIMGQAVVLIVLALTLLRVCKTLQVQLAPRFGYINFRSIIGFGFPFYAGALLIVPADYYADGLIVATHGAQALANLRVALTISTIVSLLPSLINGPMVSRFVQSHHLAPESHDEFVLLNTKILLLFSLSIAATVAPLWPEIVRLLFGAKYFPAAQHGSITLITAVLIIMVNVFSNNLIAKACLGRLFAFHASYAGVFFISSVILIPTAGLEGYLLAQFGAYMLPLAGIASIYALSVKDRPQFFTPTLTMIILTTVVAALIIWLSIFEVGLLARAGLLVFSLFCIIALNLLLVFSRAEIEMIWLRLTSMR